MSAEALGHVFRCSPYPGASAMSAALTAIADTVSDVHGYGFWMSQDELAKKARISKRRLRDALAQLEEDGWIRELYPATNREPARYRFMLDPDREIHWEPRAIRDARADEAAAGPVENPESGADAASPQAQAGPDGASSPGGRSVRSREDAASPEPKGTQANPTTTRTRGLTPVDDAGGGGGPAWTPHLTAIAGQLDTVDRARLAGERNDRLHRLTVILHYLEHDGWAPDVLAEALTRGDLAGVSSVAAVLEHRAQQLRRGAAAAPPTGPQRGAVPDEVLRQLDQRAVAAAFTDAGGIDQDVRRRVLDELAAAWLTEHGGEAATA